MWQSPEVIYNREKEKPLSIPVSIDLREILLEIQSNRTIWCPQRI
jgi:hypothetical protein